MSRRKRSNQSVETRGRELYRLEKEAGGFLDLLSQLQKWAGVHEIAVQSELIAIQDAVKSFEEKVRQESAEFLAARDKEKASQAKLVTVSKKTSKAQNTISIETRSRKIKGMVTCDKCKKKHLEAWQYSQADGRVKNLCRYCRSRLLEQKFGKSDALKHALPGSAFSAKR